MTTGIAGGPTSNWAQGLNGPALEIASTDERRLRVLAGPGTGKSFALQRRVARLLENGQSPERILVVTFTRNAATQLLQDLRNLSITGSERIRTSTLHSFCFWLLNRQDVFGLIDRVPRPIITFQSNGSLQFEGGMMLSDLTLEKRFGNKRDCTKNIAAFEAAWARLQSDDPGWPQSEIDKAFHDELQQWLQFHEAMLIGELVPEALRFLRSNPVADILSSFDHVIVDEYQDLNRAEQELVAALSRVGAIAIVGDANQSIYSFKHANPEGIEQFDIRYPDTHDATLAECYRCPTKVVSVANTLIGNNPKSAMTTLTPIASNAEGDVSIIQWETANDEVRGVTTYVEHLVKANGYKPSDILLLTPRRHFGYRMRDALKENGIPAHSFFSEEPLEGKTAQRAFCLLTLLSKPNDRVALRWWLGKDSSTGLSNAYRTLRSHCEESENSPMEALGAINRGELKLPYAQPLAKSYSELQQQLARMSVLSIPELIDDLFPAADLSLSALREIAMSCISEVANVDELFDAIKTSITQPEAPTGETVRIMSLHGSKGLTSKIAIVTGCNEGLIPYIPDDKTLAEKRAALEEQRRLFYVAITRCKEVLVISSFRSMSYAEAKQTNVQVVSFGWLGQTITSRFIDELGPSAPRPRSGFEWEASGYR